MADSSGIQSFLIFAVSFLAAVLVLIQAFSPRARYSPPGFLFVWLMLAMIVAGMFLAAPDLSARLVGWRPAEAVAELTTRLGDAMMIAGLLAVAVDRHMKRALISEITRDVLSFVAQHELPEELKTHVNRMIQYPFVRGNFEIEFAPEPIPGNDRMIRLIMTTRYEVAGLRGTLLKYPVKTAIEKSRWSYIEPSRLLEMRVFEGGADPDIVDEATLAAGQTESRRYLHFTKDYWLEPAGGAKLQVQTKRSIIVPVDWFYVLDVLETTLRGVTVYTGNTDEYDWHVDFVRQSGTEHVGSRWYHPDVYLPGQFIAVTWTRRGRPR